MPHRVRDDRAGIVVALDPLLPHEIVLVHSGDPSYPGVLGSGVSSTRRCSLPPSLAPPLPPYQPIECPGRRYAKPSGRKGDEELMIKAVLGELAVRPEVSGSVADLI